MSQLKIQQSDTRLMLLVTAPYLYDRSVNRSLITALTVQKYVHIL